MCLMFKELLIVALITTIHSVLLAQTATPKSTQNTAIERQQYTCVMHPDVVQDHPGKCPKCGMELVAVKLGAAVHRTARTEHHTHSGDWGQSPVPAMPQHDAHGAEGHAMHHGQECHAMHDVKMQSSVNLTDPMTREGSGTSWLPDSSPMCGRML